MNSLFGYSNMFSVRSLWTGLYLTNFLGCLRNRPPGRSEEDSVQDEEFWILFVEETYWYFF